MEMRLGLMEDLPTQRCEKCHSHLACVATGGRLLAFECRCGYSSVIAVAHTSLIPVVARMRAYTGPLGRATAFGDPEVWPRIRVEVKPGYDPSKWEEDE
jgi:hypothetical protein